MFDAYVAKDRVLGEMTFDFIIANEVAKSWYDNEPNQHMPERQMCLDRLRPGMTVVDGGAHHGMMSVIFSKAVGPSGKVIAYEALPSNAEIVQKNADLNSLENIAVRPVGLGLKRSRVSFTENHGNAVVGESTSLFKRLFDKREAIRVVALDADLPKGTKVDFLKIDIEGSEADAIEGMKKTIAQRPIIDLEIHNWLFPDPEAALVKLRDGLAGYRYTALGEIFGETREMGREFDIPYLRQFKNPHVFCDPII